MDRELSVKFRREKLLKNSIKIILGTIILIFAIIYIPRLIETSISRSKIRTAIIETGNIEASVNSNGTVVPEFELVLISPIETTVKKILKNPGAVLIKGQQLMELELTELTNSIDNIENQISLKINDKTKQQLDFEKRLADMNSRIKIKRLNLEVLKSKAVQQAKLLEIGGTSKERSNQAKLEADIAGIELENLENSQELDKQNYNNTIQSLETELKGLQQQRDELLRQKLLAEVRSEIDGVLTWIKQEQGAAIHKGEVIARIADLNTFKIEANVSDIHAAKFNTGYEAVIRINETELRGLITDIKPTIENGIITFNIGLQDKSNSLLRSNLRVDVNIIISNLKNILRVKNGPFANGEGLMDVFVIEDGIAYKRKVRLGASNFDYIHAAEGLNPGDEIIISDMSDYKHLNKIKIKN